MDPSSKSSPSPPDEDDVLQSASSMARNASFLFQSRRYHDCVEALKQILQKKEGDPKVLHNIEIAEYYRDGCSNPKKLLETLNDVKKRSEDLARVSGDEMDSGNNSGGNAAAGSRGTMDNAQLFSSSNSINRMYADEFDTSIAALNIGIILYHLHEYSQALSILDPLYQNIEPIEETTALHICFLILDIALASHDASKAVNVIQYLEKTFGFVCVTSQADYSNNSQSSQPSAQAGKTTSVPSNLSAVDVSTLGPVVNASSPESTLARTLSDEADYEKLFSSLDIGGHSLPRSTVIAPIPSDLGQSPERATAVIDLKLKLHLYKVRLLLLTRNLKAAKREVKSALNIARGRDSSTALLLKSQLEYAGGNQRKAIKLLMTSVNRSEPGSTSIFFNNMGCVYHKLRKHCTSTFFFSKSLESSLSMQSERPLNAAMYSQDKSLFITYNCGLQYLISDKPLLAARCFHKSSSIFYNQPLLWLRLAECSLLAHERGLLESDGLVNGEEVNVHVIGNGRSRKLIVKDASARVRPFHSFKGVELSTGEGQYKLSLPFARQCLLNALHLLNNNDLRSAKADSGAIIASSEELNQGIPAALKSSMVGDPKAANAVASAAYGVNGDWKESRGNGSAYAALKSSVSSYADIRKKENFVIKQAVLADLAFTELSLENPLKALAAANALLQLPNCSNIYLFLARIYAAESLCYMNRLNEATAYLSVYISQGMVVSIPFNDNDLKKWRYEEDEDAEELNNTVASKGTSGSTNADDLQSTVLMSAEEACGSLFVNLAAMSAMQGDLQQASTFVQQAITTIPTNPLAVLSAVYVDLLLGKSQEAIIRLKHCRHLRFFPSVQH